MKDERGGVRRTSEDARTSKEEERVKRRSEEEGANAVSIYG